MEDAREVSNAAPRSFDFTGRGGEYFRIWIVNLVLTILTLGIFSAWAKVRRLRYFYGHTQLDGHSFAYLADPFKILKGRLLAVALLIAYTAGTSLLPNLAFYILVAAVLLVPLIVVTSSAFTMRNSAWRNIRFGFRANVSEAYGVLLPPLGTLLLLVAVMFFTTNPDGVYDEQTGEFMDRADLLPGFISLCLIPVLPWLDFVRMRYVISHTRFGNLDAGFHAGMWDFYKLYIGFALRMVGVLLISGVLVFLLSFLLRAAGGLAVDPGDEPTGAEALLVLFVPIALITYGFIFMAAAWLAAHRANLLRRSTSFGSNQLEGSLMTWQVFKLYLGNAILILLTLGLFIPFAAIRLHRYNAQNTAVDTQGLDEVVAVAEQERTALGEEIGEVFDVDIGL